MRVVQGRAWWAEEVLAGTFAVHGLAHVVLGGTPIPTVVAGWLLLAVVIGLLVARRRGRRVAGATLVCGVLAGVGLFTTHLAPVWSAVSQPWHGMDIHLVWWATLYVALLGAAWAVLVSAYQIRFSFTGGRR